MTEVEKKALALLNRVRAERIINPEVSIRREAYGSHEALCRAIEAHEADKQAFSDAVEEALDSRKAAYGTRTHLEKCLARFIIAKPDPLVEVCREIGLAPYRHEEIRAALAARGLEIVEKKS